MIEALLLESIPQDFGLVGADSSITQILSPLCADAKDDGQTYHDVSIFVN